MATTGHLFEEMTAIYHPLGIAGKVAGKSSNTQWAFRQLWKKCGVHFVILPIYQEDETLHRETFENLASSPSAEKHMCMVSLENLGRSRSAEKHMRIMSAMDRLVAATGHLLRRCDGHLSSTSYC